MRPKPHECRIELVAGGPALVRGADVIRDRDGEAHPVRRPVVAVCLCGLSQRPPWCDATHKVAKD
jgi:CDGSH-type Zn-finger protein